VARRSGLGRGLGALIPTGVLGEAGSVLRELPLASIRSSSFQPRSQFDEESLASLTASVREVGVLQPVLVRPAGQDDYELIAGERRWRAAKRAGLQSIPAIVRTVSEVHSVEQALVENLHREDLNPLEEAAAYQQLLDDFGATHDELAHKVGRSRPHISNTIRLLHLPPGVQRRVAAGVLSAGHARALLALDDPDAQDRLAHRIVAEGLSVRAVEEIVAMGGDGAPKARRAAAKQPTAPGLTELANRLSDAFDTRVKVELGRRKGKIVVEFASLQDLERIVTAMSPEWAQNLSA